jgi:solute carrier family 25 phosphate transporter 23/24/25/41
MDGTDEESQEHREKRIAQLWKTLDVAGRGELDCNGLRKGLRKIDHR